jgi:dCTP deaminase
MSFWSGEKLGAELPRLIDPFDAEQIDCAAYTLRIGPEVYISPSNATEASTRTKITLAEKQSFVIPPGQFAFLLTEEQIEVPNFAIAFISMKARIKFKGLVNVSGFHVDPGYRGRLVFAVFNAGPAHVQLARGDDCFLIWYASLDNVSQRIRTDPPFNGITSELITPVAGELQSLAGLSSRIQTVEREQQVIRERATIAITLFVTLIALTITLLSRSCQMLSTPTPSPSVSSPTVGPPGAAPAPAPAANPAPMIPPAASPVPANPSSRSGRDSPVRGRSQ